MRRLAALAGLALVLAAAEAPAETPAPCEDRIAAARYDRPTTRYVHGVFGDPQEWGGMAVTVAAHPACAAESFAFAVELPQELVFEDTAPRLADLDGDGRPELLTVEAHRDLGARLAVWGLVDGAPERLAATPFIGRPQRWPAPVGAADLDGDGRIEIAYVDRPHLARLLRIWAFEDGALVHRRDIPGLTNHRFGDREISGGIRDCGTGPEIVTADAGWTRLVATRLTPDGPATRDLGPVEGTDSFRHALACR